MTADELLRRYPRETLRWLRDRLGLTRGAFARRVGVVPLTVRHWEDGRHSLSPHSRARVSPLLAPYLVTPEGEALLSGDPGRWDLRANARAQPGGDGGMTPDDLLRRYPRETLRWLRGRRELTQLDLALRVGVGLSTAAAWETGRRAISPANRTRIAILLALDLATAEGASFLQSLGRGEEETT